MTPPLFEPGSKVWLDDEPGNIWVVKEVYEPGVEFVYTTAQLIALHGRITRYAPIHSLNLIPETRTRR